MYNITVTTNIFRIDGNNKHIPNIDNIKHVSVLLETYKYCILHRPQDCI